MSTKVLLAGLLGGLGMFVWMAVAHIVLPLGQAGIREIPNEQAVLSQMQATIGTASGLYFFPGMDRSASMDKYAEKLAQNPSGILIYHPPGRQSMTGGQLFTEFVLEVIEALLAALLLAQTRIGGFGGKVGFVAVTGILASIATNGSYWNWYGFPGTYTLANMTSQFVGFVVAGLVIAYFVKPPAVTT